MSSVDVAEELKGLKVLRRAKAQLASIIHIEGEHDVVRVAEPGDPGVVDVVDAFPHLFDPLEMDDPGLDLEGHAVPAVSGDDIRLARAVLDAEQECRDRPFDRIGPLDRPRVEDRCHVMKQGRDVGYVGPGQEGIHRMAFHGISEKKLS